MALDKLVDSSQLDADLTTIANAIRTKGGTSAQLAFPDGMADAIAAIPSGGGDSNVLTFSFVPASYNEQIQFDISDTFDVSTLRTCCFSAIDFVLADSYEGAVTFAGFSVSGYRNTGYSFHYEANGTQDVNTASSFSGNYFKPSFSGGSWQVGTTYKAAVVGVLK